MWDACKKNPGLFALSTVEDAQFIFKVYFENNQALGFISYLLPETSLEFQIDLPTLNQIYVVVLHQERRRREGIASELINDFIQSAKALGYGEVDFMPTNDQFLKVLDSMGIDYDLVQPGQEVTKMEEDKEEAS